jgi:hypothetical protein
MRDITDEMSAWEHHPFGNNAVIGVSMMITSACRDPFGDVAARILPGLPRLRAATITAYYR